MHKLRKTIFFLNMMTAIMLSYLNLAQAADETTQPHNDKEVTGIVTLSEHVVFKANTLGKELYFFCGASSLGGNTLVREPERDQVYRALPKDIKSRKIDQQNFELRYSYEQGIDRTVFTRGYVCEICNNLVYGELIRGNIKANRLEPAKPIMKESDFFDESQKRINWPKIVKNMGPK